jgi:hypothetical protein
MSESLVYRSKQFVAVIAAAVALTGCMLIGPAAKADAYQTTVYCDGKALAAWWTCEGALRRLYGIYGWGDQHAVCIFVSTGTGYPYYQKCSGGPGEGVYSAIGGPETQWYPSITNIAGNGNIVHGRAYTS